jgi:hypothetical protein
MDNRDNRLCPKLKILGVSLTFIALGNVQMEAAQPPPKDGNEFNAPPKVMELLQTRLYPPQVSDQTPSRKSLTIPGLWWANRQFGDRMVVNWYVYRRPQDSNSQVRLIVRPDLWSRYTSLERYAFLTRFGTSTSAAGYHLIVLDRQNFPLGAYICEFAPQTDPYPLYPWLKKSPPPSALPSIAQVPCRVWISPVYGTQLF